MYNFFSHKACLRNILLMQLAAVLIYLSKYLRKCIEIILCSTRTHLSIRNYDVGCRLILYYNAVKHIRFDDLSPINLQTPQKKLTQCLT